MTHCGCYMPGSVSEYCNPRQVKSNQAIGRPIPVRDKNQWGYYRKDAVCDDIWHLREVTADKLIIAYQASPEVDEDNQVLVPKYAILAMQHGIKYYSVMFKTNVTPAQINFFERTWNRYVIQLNMYMYPISLEDIYKLSQRAVKW